MTLKLEDDGVKEGHKEGKEKNEDQQEGRQEGGRPYRRKDIKKTMEEKKKRIDLK